MNNIERFLTSAHSCAILSDGVGPQRQFRLGSVLVEKRRVISSGRNSYATNKFLGKFYQWPFMHAEADAIFRCGFERAEGCTLYVVRLQKNGNRALSKPCESCFSLLQYSRVKKVIYSIDNVQYGELKI